MAVEIDRKTERGVFLVLFLSNSTGNLKLCDLVSWSSLNLQTNSLVLLLLQLRVVIKILLGLMEYNRKNIGFHYAQS